jgi:putative heme-binding domain-containing protein
MSFIQESDDVNIQASAVRLLLQLNGSGPVLQALQKKEVSHAHLISALGAVTDKNSKDILQQVVFNKQLPVNERLEATTALGHGNSGEDRLLELLKKEQLPKEVTTAAVEIFKNAHRQEVREAAAKYLDLAPETKGKLPEVAALLKMKGNAKDGAAVFEMYCTACHVVNGKGIDFGPNLSEIGSKLSAEAMYKAILTPSEGISFGYEGYNFRLTNGTTLSGYIASETEKEITIKLIGGVSEKHQKTEIAEKKPHTISLMPEGLGESMGAQKLTDVVAYISTLKKKA